MKKNFIPSNPVLSVLGLQDDDAIVISPAPEKKERLAPQRVESQVERQEPVKRPTPRPRQEERQELKGYLDELDAPRPPKPETKSKRLNLLVKPSTLKEATKIANKYGISVNELINRLLEGCVKNHK